MTDHEQEHSPRFETNQAMSNQAMMVPSMGGLLAPSSNGFAGQHPFGMPVSRSPEAVSGGMDRSWFFHSLRRRWLLATCMGLLIGGLSAGFLYWLFPESRSATAIYQVAAEEPTVLESSREPASYYETLKATQLAALKSYYVLSAALRDPEVQGLSCLAKVKEDDKIQWLADRIEATFPQKSEYLNITISGPEPAEELRKLVNAVSRAYEEEVVFSSRGRRLAMREVLDKASNGLSQQVKSVMESYLYLAKEMNAPIAGSRDTQTQLLISDVLAMERQKTDLESKAVALQTDFAVMQQLYKNPLIVEAQIEEAMKADPMISMLQQQIMSLEYYIMQLQSVSKRGNSPSVKQYEKQKAAMEQQVAQYRQEMKQQMLSQQRYKPNPQLQAAMTDYQTRSVFLGQQLQLVNQELDKKKEELRERGELSVDLMQKKGELDSLQQVATSIQKKREVVNVEMASLERIIPIQPAQPSENINAYQRYAITTLGGIGGLALTCFAIAYLEFRNRRLNGPQQVDEGLGIRVIGTLPSLSSRNLSQSSPVVAQLMESVDSVRTALMHDSTSKRRQVVLVTGAGTMEGRTTVASQLAASLARAGRRTLLIDGDLRHPALHSLFDVPLEDGLCEVLRAEVDVADVIRPTHAEGLWLLTAGYCDVDAVHALATDQIQPIFDKLRADYDFILIDGAPVLGVSDSLLFGQFCDGAILSVLKDHTSVPKIYQAAELLKSVGIRLIGAVVNGVSEKADNRVMHLQLAAPKSERKQLQSTEA